MGHHVLSGQCNYNVCCPMTDHLLGTYVPTEVWQTKMRPLPANAQVRGPVVEPMVTLTLTLTLTLILTLTLTRCAAPWSSPRAAAAYRGCPRARSTPRSS